METIEGLADELRSQLAEVKIDAPDELSTVAIADAVVGALLPGEGFTDLDIDPEATKAIRTGLQALARRGEIANTPIGVTAGLLVAELIVTEEVAVEAPFSWELGYDLNLGDLSEPPMVSIENMHVDFRLPPGAKGLDLNLSLRNLVAHEPGIMDGLYTLQGIQRDESAAALLSGTIEGIGMADGCEIISDMGQVGETLGSLSLLVAVGELDASLQQALNVAPHLLLAGGRLIISSPDRGTVEKQLGSIVQSNLILVTHNLDAEQPGVGGLAILEKTAA